MCACVHVCMCMYVVLMYVNVKVWECMEWGHISKNAYMANFLCGFSLFIDLRYIVFLKGKRIDLSRYTNNITDIRYISAKRRTLPVDADSYTFSISTYKGDSNRLLSQCLSSWFLK